MAELTIKIRMRLVSLMAGRDDRGASLVEYALLLALIAIVAFVAIEFLGGETSSMYSDMGNSFNG